MLLAYHTTIFIRLSVRVTELLFRNRKEHNHKGMGNGWRKWTAALAACLMLVMGSGCYAEVWQGTSLTGENGGYSLENELYGEIHLEYEVGGFDVSQGGEVKTKVRARPVDKAILVRKGMRITGGGTYQVTLQRWIPPERLASTCAAMRTSTSCRKTGISASW